MSIKEFKNMLSDIGDNDFRVVICIFKRGGDKLYDRIPNGGHLESEFNTIFTCYPDLDCPDYSFTEFKKKVNEINDMYDNSIAEIYDGEFYNMRDSYKVDYEEWRVLLYAEK